MISRKRATVLSILTATALMGGGVLAAHAFQVPETATGAVTAALAAPVMVDTPEAGDKPDAADGEVTSSLKVDEATYAKMSETDETAALAKLAKITSAQAQQIAEKAVPGTASSTELSNEDGSVIYRVQIGATDVSVDAGNGAVLEKEQHHNGGDHADKNESAEGGTETQD